MRLISALLAGSLIGLSGPALAASLAASGGHLPHALPVTRAAVSITVLDIQRALNAAGYDAGTADGLMGRKTQAAIEAYQRDHRLLVTGEPSNALLEHIRANADAAKAAPPPTDTSPPAIQPGDPAVRALQQDLRALGYDIRETGRVDSQTHDAIRAYERDHKLLVTGEYNRVLAEHVRNAATKAEREREREEASKDRNQGSQWTEPGKRPAADRQTLSAIQQQLHQRGYPVDSVAGDWSPATEAAIRSYQRDYGRPVNGEPNAELARHLRDTNGDDLSRDRIREVQTALNRRGYDTGQPDGQLGPNTRKAIAAYRRDQKMEPIGAMSPNLWRSLGVPDRLGPTDAANRDRDDDEANGPRDRMQVLVRDRFDDGDYARNPAWQVLSGRFDIRDGALFSAIADDPRRNDEGSLRDVLGQALGVPADRRSEAAVAALPVRFDGAFRLRFRVRGNAPGGGTVFNFGAYLDRNAGTGYRVTVGDSRRGGLKLWAVRDGRSRHIATAYRQLPLDDGEWHRVVLEREDDGTLRLAIDREEVLSAKDRDFQRFDGVSFINKGGDWWLDNVAVATPGDR